MKWKYDEYVLQTLDMDGNSSDYFTSTSYDAVEYEFNLFQTGVRLVKRTTINEVLMGE